jgi:serine/threonine-protein kinase RIO1
VHTDLSAFNILVHEGEPWFIDFSEALRVDRTGDAPWMRLEQARAALQSGLSALQKYFNKYGLQIDTGSRVSRIVRGLDRFGVLE